MSVKLKAAAVCAVILTAALLLLPSCGSSSRDNKDGAADVSVPEYSETEKEEEIPMHEITADYVIVVPANSKGDIKAANRLKKALGDAGLELRFIDDSWGQNEHEIILGAADRADAVIHDEIKMPGDWSLSLTDDGNIIAQGDTEAAVEELLKYVKDGKFFVPQQLNILQKAVWELVFEDNFDGTELDTTKWSRCPEWQRKDYGGRWDDEMTLLDGNGHLLSRVDMGAKVPLSGAVRTIDTFRTTYGYFEIRCTLHKAQGMWGAFWMMLGPDVGAGNGTEIDIFESLANEKRIYFTMHYGGYDEYHQSESANIYAPEMFDGSFHTFSFWWDKEKYVWYLDGKEVFRSSTALVHQSGYMKISTECGSWGGPLKPDELPSDMLVDYVRVYKRAD
ncbi:MAG TPA: glycoside hydrolase family 16 protein [Clostridiales bacterium]|jgi:hypothetical protein|nr:glycoside hydrolase family 16 protein [Clostridiales bacterium]